MEPLFKTRTQYTYTEYERLCMTINMQPNRFPKAAVLLCGAFLILSCLFYFMHLPYVSIVFAGMIVLAPLGIFLSLKMQIKKTYAANSLVQDAAVILRFFEDHLEIYSAKGYSYVQYSDIVRILETKTNYYLMISDTTGIIAVKENCEPALQKFIKTMKA